jgi:hypothetical protein
MVASSAYPAVLNVVRNSSHFFFRSLVNVVRLTIIRTRVVISYHGLIGFIVAAVPVNVTVV